MKKHFLQPEEGMVTTMLPLFLSKSPNVMKTAGYGETATHLQGCMPIKSVGQEGNAGRAWASGAFMLPTVAAL